MKGKSGEDVFGLFESIALAGAGQSFSPSDPAAPYAAQAEDVFSQITEALASRGLAWKDVVRTWFYLDDIYSWYGDFNKVRTAHFAKHGVVVPPASTGIGLKAGKGAVRASVLVAPDGWKSVESPLQVPATDYKSSFSRAAEANGVLYVSGTASILPGSREVAYPGDFPAQLVCTLNAVEAILKSKGTRWSGVSRAVAYCKKEEYIHAAKRKMFSLGLKEEALFCLVADVCRDEWLFELEVDAPIP